MCERCILLGDNGRWLGVGKYTLAVPLMIVPVHWYLQCPQEGSEISEVLKLHVNELSEAQTKSLCFHAVVR